MALYFLGVPHLYSQRHPGDTLEIRIKKIVMKESGFNFNLPGKQFPAVSLLSEFPEGHLQYFKLDTETMTTEFKPGITLQLNPFPGTIAVSPDPHEPKEKAGPLIHDAKGRTITLRPWKNGSNKDVNELHVGSTLYFQVFQKGGFIWTGDSHCLQGNGEVNLTALECSYREIEIQPIVPQGSSHRLAARGDLHTLDFHGFRRRLERSHEPPHRQRGDFESKSASRALFSPP
jgi:acetamidase/formamidase